MAFAAGSTPTARARPTAIAPTTATRLRVLAIFRSFREVSLSAHMLPTNRLVWYHLASPARKALATQSARVYRVDMAKHHDIAEVLRTRIADGTYALNNRLPGLELLAAEFGVSNGVIRRAEASLEQAGILRIAQGEGAFVIRVPAKVDMLAELKEMRTTINRLIEALEGSR